MAAGAPPPQPIFHYDLGSPECYLVAEQIMAALPIVPEWEPVHGATFPGAREPDRRSIELLAQGLELQPLRWPGAWPPDTHLAMLTATYAKRVGRAVAFSLAAFRQAFAGGRDLGQESSVLLAAAACEMHPAAVLKGIRLRSVETALREAGARAQAAGVRTLPAVQVGDRVFEGRDALPGAAEALARVAP
ncbi:MAG: DsbA family protein [Solirubrobacteraceae bacterium]